MGMFTHAEPDPNFYVGREVYVTPNPSDCFIEFSGVAIETRNGHVLVRDQFDDVHEVDADQLTLE